MDYVSWGGMGVHGLRKLGGGYGGYMDYVSWGGGMGGTWIT